MKKQRYRHEAKMPAFRVENDMKTVSNLCMALSLIHEELQRDEGDRFKCAYALEGITDSLEYLAMCLESDAYRAISEYLEGGKK